MFPICLQSFRFLTLIFRKLLIFSKLELILNYLPELHTKSHEISYGKMRCARDFEQMLFWACSVAVLVYYHPYGGRHIGKLAWKCWLFARKSRLRQNCTRPSYRHCTLWVYFLKLLSNYSIKSLDILYMNRP